MTESPLPSLYDLPLPDLRVRARRARAVLRAVRARLARTRDALLLREALDAVDRLVPGLTESPAALLARTLLSWAPHERLMLRRAIDAERSARERLSKLLGGLPAAAVDDALARVEVHCSLARELDALLSLLRAGASAPLLA